MKKITFSYVVGDFFHSDQFLPKYWSGKFVEHLIYWASISYNAYHDAYNAWSGSPLFVENVSLFPC